MLLHRLAKEKYIRDLSGAGARMYGGRWNQKGVPALYTSEHRSLAILEFLVHTSLHALPPDLALLALSVAATFDPDKLPKTELPANWRNYPAPSKLARLGTDWLHSGNNLLLKVPSVIVPDEWNVVVNPAHHQFNQVEIKSISAFDLDSRFLSTAQNQSPS